MCRVSLTSNFQIQIKEKPKMERRSATKENLKERQLSEKAITFFHDRPEMLAHITRDQTPFAAEYTPSLVEILFEDIVYIRYEDGSITATRESKEGFAPAFWEACFDGETALFVIGDGEIIVDRVQEMAELDVLMGKFNVPLLEVHNV
jgi:hypothetical protein